MRGLADGARILQDKIANLQLGLGHQVLTLCEAAASERRRHEIDGERAANERINDDGKSGATTKGARHCTCCTGDNCCHAQQRDLTGNDKPLFIIFIFPATHYCRLCLMDYNSTCPRLSTTLHELSTALSTTQLPPPDPLTVRFARHRPEASASQIYFGARRKRCWRWKSLRWRCRWCSRRWRCRR